MFILGGCKDFLITTIVFFCYCCSNIPFSFMKREITIINSAFIGDLNYNQICDFFYLCSCGILDTLLAVISFSFDI